MYYVDLYETGYILELCKIIDKVEDDMKKSRILLVLPLFLLYFVIVELIIGISIKRDVWKDIVEWSKAEK